MRGCGEWEEGIERGHDYCNCIAETSHSDVVNRLIYIPLGEHKWSHILCQRLVVLESTVIPHNQFLREECLCCGTVLE